MESSTVATAPTTKTKWVLDPTHSENNFKVKHLMISNVKGEFRKFTAEINAIGTDFANASILANIDASSIFTNEDNRDNHLKSADFFDTENYPELTFVGTSFEKTGGDEFTLTGDLTIKGTTKPVTLDVEFGGINKDPYGNEKAAFSLTGKINRKDWGLNWNAALETGGVLVSEEVKISAEMQFVKQN
jgi:polyisoprenoid-binding protein YceI